VRCATRMTTSSSRLPPPATPTRSSPATAISVVVARTLGRCRLSAARSQEQLCFAAGLHRNYVGAIERGEINPTLRVLCKVGYGLRVPVSDVLVMAERLAA
jgi:DNA-binding XRE family transcriptional regulator